MSNATIKILKVSVIAYNLLATVSRYPIRSTTLKKKNKKKKKKINKTEKKEKEKKKKTETLNQRRFNVGPTLSAHWDFCNLYM